jgi:hypothetical protein
MDCEDFEVREEVRASANEVADADLLVVLPLVADGENI